MSSIVAWATVLSLYSIIMVEGDENEAKSIINGKNFSWCRFD